MIFGTLTKEWSNLKVVQYNNFVATPSVFKSLLLKQIDLFDKTSNTCISHRLNYDIIFWVIGINITWQWRQNSFSFKNGISTLIDLNFGNALRCAILLWVLFFRCAKFHRNLWEEFRDILKVLKKGINYAWTDGWTLCKQICYFLDVSGKVLCLIHSRNLWINKIRWLNT